MASWLTPYSDGIRITPFAGSQWGLTPYRRPPGVTSGRWVCYGNLVWVRLGSRSSWQDEDMDANMIDPVEP